MNTRILHCALLILFLAIISSCVSKKKFAESEKVREKAVAMLASRDGECAKTSAAYDSLKVLVLKKDSLIDSLVLKLSDFNQKKEKDKTKIFASKKPSSMTKDQEYERKAQFVYNFAAYIEWPVIYNGTEFVIGVAGDDYALKKIRETIGTKKIGGKKVKIEKYNKVTNYHLVYVTSTNTAAFAAIKNDSKKNKTILISDDDALFYSGAHISFIMDEDKVKYAVNKASIEKVGLKVSQELMRFSE